MTNEAGKSSEPVEFVDDASYFAWLAAHPRQEGVPSAPDAESDWRCVVTQLMMANDVPVLAGRRARFRLVPRTARRESGELRRIHRA